MKKIITFFIVFCLAAMVFAAFPPYDKSADPFKELQKAKETAQNENKRIIVFVGGPWCGWCAMLDDFIKKDKELAAMIEKNFVVIKVYAEKDLTPNGLFLAKYPTPPSFPHIYILNSKGELLESKKTELLEKGEGYDKEKVKEFLNYYALKK